MGTAEFFWGVKTSPDECVGVIYELWSPSGKVYVGKTSQRNAAGDLSAKKRIEQHIRAAKSGEDSCRLINRAIRKYGIEKFRIEVWPPLARSDKELDDLEKVTIAGYVRFGVGVYNLAAGGEGGKLSPESRAKIGAALRGKKQSPETVAKNRAGQIKRFQNPLEREKVSAFHKGRKQTPEARANIAAAVRKRYEDPAEREKQRIGTTRRFQDPAERAKISAQQKGRVKSPQERANLSKALKGRKLSAEWREKISAAHKGKKLTPEHRAKIKAGLARRRARNSGGQTSLL